MPTSLSDRRRMREERTGEGDRADASREVAEFAARALATDSLEEVLDDAVQVAARVLQVPLASMFTLTNRGSELFWAAGVGWAPGLVRQMSVSAEEGSLCSVALRTDTVAHSADFDGETRFAINPVLKRHNVVSGLATPLVLRGVPYGTLTVFDTRTREFTPSEVTSLSLLGSLVAAAVARAEADAALLRQVMRDPLTGLANRALFHDRTSRSLLRASPESMVVVILADLDAFKLVNDSHGHATGDELLTALAPRLVDALPHEATVARLGGDEFAICVDGVPGPAAAHELGRNVSAALAGRVVLAGRELFVTASVGVAVTDRPDVISGDLLREADVAMYRAKELGRGRVEIYDRQLRRRVADRLALETDLIRAAEGQEFSLAYQPLVHLSTGEVRGVEALLRWPRRERAACPPAVFVPVLEECGLINAVGQRVLVDAARQMIVWQQRHGPQVHLSVNASAHQLGRPELLEAVEQVYAEGLAPGTLFVEVTETALLQSTRDVRGWLDRLRAVGAGIVLDDFGTGYSSLSHLIDFPMDMLKIDRSFVAGLGTQRKQTAVTESVIALAHRLSLRVVAEGVETEEQRRLVTELGCDYGQGYLWAAPVTADNVGALLHGRSPQGDAAARPA